MNSRSLTGYTLFPATNLTMCYMTPVPFVYYEMPSCINHAPHNARKAIDILVARLAAAQKHSLLSLCPSLTSCLRPNLKPSCIFCYVPNSNSTTDPEFSRQHMYELS